MSRLPPLPKRHHLPAPGQGRARLPLDPADGQVLADALHIERIAAHEGQPGHGLRST